MLERYKDGRWMAHGRFLASWAAALLLLGACVEIAGFEEPHAKDPEWADWPMPNPASAGLPNAASYSVDNGIVTDNVTGLMWQRDIYAGLRTWAEAKSYCANLDYGGYDDWRLPTGIELTSLLDFTKEIPPTIDTYAFPNTPGEAFWTSSSSVDSPASAWYVRFSDSGSNFGDVALPHRVRCVRLRTG